MSGLTPSLLFMNITVMVVSDDQNTTVGMNGRVYMSYDDNGDLVHVLDQQTWRENILVPPK